MKIAVVGGGSTYTPELVDGLARLRDLLPVDEIALMDPDASRLQPVGGIGRRILAERGHPAALVTTGDLERAVDGADAVLFQLRVGGQAARQGDEAWPLQCGCIGQETTGAGGLAKALRTVPVVLDLAERVRATSPKAWIVNFTNPVGIVTRALLGAGQRAVGLCNVAIGLQRFLASLLTRNPDELLLDYFGLNHLTWVRGVTIGSQGPNLLPQLIRDSGSDLAAHLDLPERAIQLSGLLPSYYLRYYYQHDLVVEEQRRGPSRAEEVARIESQLLALYADPQVTTKPALLDRRGGAYYSEAAVALAAALLTGQGPPQVVNVPNEGTLAFLPDDAVVEVVADIGLDGAVGRPLAAVPPVVAGLIAHVFGYEQLALEAARFGGRDRVARALLAHPLVGQLDVADRLADLLVAANRRYLPWA